MIATVLTILATWFGLSAAATYVWVTWRMRGNDRLIAERTRTDWDAELRDLIEQNRT